MGSENQEDLAAFRGMVARQRQPLPRELGDQEMVFKADAVQWFTPKGTNPSRLGLTLGLPIRTFELLLQDIPPGGASDMQQHHHEAVHYVIDGSGYSEIGPGRYDWGPGDFVCVPPMQWHRHYNGSAESPVRMLLVENSKLLEALDLNYRYSAGLITYSELMQQRAVDGE